MARYLTKSRFLLALNCPTKLYYTGKAQYPDTKEDNEFLEALARGGFQVGALAKCYYPGGNEITTLDKTEAVAQTNELLKQENVVIFEPAFRAEKFFLRADILEKKGNRINLLEVKSKSFGGNSSLDMMKNGYLDKGWKKYVYDVAFQKYVISQARPDWKINAYLMLTNKNAVATVDGLNQKFLLREQADERTIVELMGDTSPEALGDILLIRVNVDDLCEMIFQGRDAKDLPAMTFEQFANYLADQYRNDRKIITPIHKDCGNCEFRASDEEEQEGRLSGYKECFRQQLGWADTDFATPTIYDIWDFRTKRGMIAQGIFHFNELKPFHIGPDAEDTSAPLTRQGRQWLQVTRSRNNNPEPFVDAEGLQEEMSHWKYPLHMIDFETSTVAVPFYKGRRPYEQTAFQFSHHIISEDGSIEHKGQYLNTERGVFPNFEFVRRLKDELSIDDGSVFKYSAHENTILNHIMVQLQESSKKEVPDKEELIAFIKSITHTKGPSGHTGPRDMIDLLDVVKKHYWHPLMGGSNSLKAVLPAVLNSSAHLQEKYSRPVYGKHAEVKSLNFDDGWCWIQFDEAGNVISPYKLLPSLFDDFEMDEVEEILLGDRLEDGGAAMTAYAMMQFTAMGEAEKARIAEGLLRYCELDTLAMVFLWEYFNSTM